VTEARRNAFTLLVALVVACATTHCGNNDDTGAAVGGGAGTVGQTGGSSGRSSGGEAGMPSAEAGASSGGEAGTPNAEAGAATVAAGGEGNADSSLPSDAVEWKPSDGGNGHHYLVRTISGGITWDDANAAAMKLGGHLATSTSAAENEFIFSVAAADNSAWVSSPMYNAVDGPWLGAVKNGSTWTWVTGEPWAYTDWAKYEPTGSYNGYVEDRIQMRNELDSTNPAATWNDAPSAATEPGYVVEFE